VALAAFEVRGISRSEDAAGRRERREQADETNDNSKNKKKKPRSASKNARRAEALKKEQEQA